MAGGNTMSEETKAAHISGRYLLISVVLTAVLTFLFSFPIGSSIGETKGNEEIDKISKQYGEEVASITSKYDNLLIGHEEMQKQFDNLEHSYSDLLQEHDTLENDYSDLLKKYEALGKDYDTLSQKYNRLQNESKTPEDTSLGDFSPESISQFEFLSNLIPVSGTMSNDQYGLWDVSGQDNYGNKYSSGIYMKQAYSDKFHLVYALDSKYEKLTGKFVLAEGSKNTNGHYTLYAYSLIDGNMSFLGESEVLATATRPIDVEFDVSGVMDLVIEVYDPNKSSDNAWTAFVDAKLE